jgi:hypothetical protein
MMRPTVGVKPQERIVLYTDMSSSGMNPNTFGPPVFGVGAATTTNYFKVTWWDGTSEIVDCSSFPQKNGGTVQRGCAFKRIIIDTLKKVIVESCDSSGKLTGNITFFACDKRQKTVYSTSGIEDYNLSTRTLDTSTCQQLKVLKCDRNKLTSLGDINACKNISTIACSGNCFASIDVSKLPNLEQFFCNHNSTLTSLTTGPNLKRLGASSCGFTGISFPSGSQLVNLYIKDSLLTGITVDNIQTLRSISLSTQVNNYRELNPPSLTSFSGNTLPNLSELSFGIGYYCNHPITNKVSSIRLSGSMKGSLPDSIIGNQLIQYQLYLLLNGCSMSSSALNTVYSDLRSITSDGYPIAISVEGITGYAGSNTTTATAKGYIFNAPPC